jgi:hypothetical protein
MEFSFLAYSLYEQHAVYNTWDSNRTQLKDSGNSRKGSDGSTEATAHLPGGLDGSLCGTGCSLNPSAWWRLLEVEEGWDGKDPELDKLNTTHFT